MAREREAVSDGVKAVTGSSLIKAGEGEGRDYIMGVPRGLIGIRRIRLCQGGI